MNTVLVRYLCWGCGSTVEKYETVDDDTLPRNLEQWNLCPDCIEKAKQKREKKL